MCGIWGIIKQGELEFDVFAAMATAFRFIAGRGPDARDFRHARCFDHSVLVAHSRLSILRGMTAGLVPDAIRLNRKKRGFDVTQDWVSHGIGASLRARIFDNRTRLSGRLKTSKNLDSLPMPRCHNIRACSMKPCCWHGLSIQPECQPG